MGLALAPQCCCGVPGIWRWGPSNAFIDPAYADQFGCYSSPDDWMVNTLYYGYENCARYGYFGEHSLSLAPLLGYDSYGDRLYFQAPIGGSYPPRYASSSGGIQYLPLGRIADRNFTAKVAISDFDADAILARCRQEAGNDTFGDVLVKWCEYSNGRLYGFVNWWDTVGHTHFKAWSTRTDGTDYIEHFTLIGDYRGSGSGGWPVSYDRDMTVANGHCYMWSIQGSDTGAKYRLYRDGSLISTMHPESVYLGTLTMWATPVATLEVDGQCISLVAYSDYQYSFPAIVLVEQGTYFNSQVLRCVVGESGLTPPYDPNTPWGMWPTRIGWDERRESVVIEWSSTWANAVGFNFPFDRYNTTGGGVPFGGDGPYQTIVSYHKKKLVPGNIVGQDGVEFYPTLPFGAVQQGNDPRTYGVVIPGKMPPTLDLTGPEIDPPPPPPPPKTPCNHVDDCQNVSGVAYLTGSPDVTVAGGQDEFGTDLVSTTWYYKNLYRAFTATKLPPGQGVPLGVCAASGTGMEYDFWGNFTSGFDGRYDHPGILIRTMDYGDARIHSEMYLSDIILGVNCVSGDLTLAYMVVAVQEWFSNTANGDVWPPTSYPRFWNCLGVIPGRIVTKATAGQFGCSSTTMVTVFSFTNLLSGGIQGDNFINVQFSYGPQP